MGWNEERVAVFSLLPPEVVVFGLVDTEGNECDFFRFTETLFLGYGWVRFYGTTGNVVSAWAVARGGVLVSVEGK
jgi:hypothetical protein